MIDPAKLDRNVREECEEFQQDNADASQFADMGSSECFEQYCLWNGIVGYAAQLEAALDSCRRAETPTPVRAVDAAWRTIAREAVETEVERMRADGITDRQVLLDRLYLDFQDNMIDAFRKAVEGALSNG